MSLNCKLNRNISLSQPGDSGDSCNSQDISIGVGGISTVLVYNISDVPSLKFENDNRSDDTLVVDTINSTGQFYKIDFTSASYNEEFDPNSKWTHTLTLDVNNISSLFEDILSDGVHGRYLVCFKPNGSEDYRMFGWKYGATLDYSLNIAEDSGGYTITLEDTSEYPLFTVYGDNFGNNSKVYTPIFKPLWETYFCEKNQEGKNTGYAIAMYVVKVNAAGQPLDKNNRLVQWSGLKQDAYKHNSITSDGGFNIIGTYASSAQFDGRPVKVFDLEKCTSQFDNSIYIDDGKSKDVCLNSSNKSATFTIRSSDAWSLVNQSDFATITPTRGLSGDTVCTVYHNGIGGTNEIQFQNDYTKEIVTLNIVANIISVQSSFTLPNRTHSMVVTPTVYGCSEDYTYTISPSAGVSRVSNGYLYIQFSFVDDDNEHNYTLTLTHTCDGGCVESKEINIKILGNNTDPSWSILSSFCEITD
jgi:hypothetical protein